ncbi:hypothetical protein FH972_022494 [Carpinus fangiana]|uniref:Methyltransferase domain-containing protein n=1 Tax=Carpinus fangiana TaxID=176857 RepID=A0A5N6KSF1_9ROSI|nr:hypothetical protein FH972_022494 [Carpinus fangiana]
MTDTQPETPLIGSNAPDARARLLAHFNHDYEKHPTLWDDLYKQDFIPWDKGFSNPALADTLSDRTDILGSPMHSLGRRKRALVPGCGKGYDVLLLASFGYDAFGLEVSERALEACKETVQKASDTRPTNSEHGKGSFNFVSGDFFKDGWVEKAGAANDGFDLIYDYTVCLEERRRSLLA